jgi:hypothetical protein
MRTTVNIDEDVLVVTRQIALEPPHVARRGREFSAPPGNAGIILEYV